MTSTPTFQGLRSYLPLCHNKAMYNDSTHPKKSLVSWILSLNYYYRAWHWCSKSLDFLTTSKIALNYVMVNFQPINHVIWKKILIVLKQWILSLRRRHWEHYFPHSLMIYKNMPQNVTTTEFDFFNSKL